MNTRPMTPAQALSRAQDLCARAEKCTYEIAEKLRRWGIAPSAQRAIIDKLVDERYIDDARYATALVRDKMYFAGWGRRKIAQALYMKRLPKDIIDEAMAAIDADEYRDCARRVTRARLRQAPLDDEGRLAYDDRMRVMRTLMGRGFEAGLISALIDELLSAEDGLE